MKKKVKALAAITVMMIILVALLGGIYVNVKKPNVAKNSPTFYEGSSQLNHLLCYGLIEMG